jgi:hypothetical protein
MLTSKLVAFGLAAALCLGQALGQTSAIPNAINLQAVARTATGSIIANQTGQVRLTVREGSGTGTALYCATHQQATNAFDSFNVLLNRNALNTSCLWLKDRFCLQKK